MTRDYKKQMEWKRKNQVFIGLSLSRSTDSDIIGYMDRKIAEGETKQGIIKRSLRNTMRDEGYSSFSDSGSAMDPGEAVAETTPEYSADKEEREDLE